MATPKLLEHCMDGRHDEPTAPAGGGVNEPAQHFQQIFQQVTQGSGSPPDTFDFTSEPPAELWKEMDRTSVPLAQPTSGGAASSGEVLTESITLVHQGFELG